MRNLGRRWYRRRRRRREEEEEEEEGEPATVQPAGSVHGGPADNCRTTGRAHAIPVHRHHLQHR